MRRTIIMMLRFTAVAGAAVLFAGAARAQTPGRSQPFASLDLLRFERWAGEAKIPVRTETHGGDGGASFDDSPSDIDTRGRINKIVVRHGAEVDAIGVGYVSGNYFNHGSTGGTETSIDLGPDEFIVGVAGRTGGRLDQITFYSNKKQYGPYGGGGGSPFKKIDFPKGKVLLYLFGRSGRSVDQIGFGYGNLPPALPTTIVRSDAHGGTGGDPFDDLNSKGLLGKIQSITVRHGDLVHNIKVKYKDGPEISHGGGGGREDTFSLEDDEWLTEIRGRSGGRLDQVQFVTSKARFSPLYGGNGGSPFVLKRDKCVLKAFFGRSADDVDQLGVYYEDAKPLTIEILEMNYDLDKSQILMLPPLALMSVNLENKTSSVQPVSQTVQVTTTDSYTLTVSDYFEGSYTMKFTKDFGAVKSEVSFGFKYGHTTTTASQHTDTRTQSFTFTANAPPRTRSRPPASPIKKPTTSRGRRRRKSPTRGSRRR
jgi:hypothetical protein